MDRNTLGDISRTLSLPKGILKKVNVAAVDIGGSVVKIVYARSVDDETDELVLQNFANRNLEKALSYLRHNCPIVNGERKIFTTGVGCMLHKNTIEKYLGVKIVNLEEMTCMRRALQLLLNVKEEAEIIYPVSSNVQDFLDCYTMQMLEMKQKRIEVLNAACQETDYIYPNPFNVTAKLEEKEQTQYPYLLAMLGSGCIIMQVEESGYKVIDTTASCGRTFMALTSLLTGTKTYQEVIELAGLGDHTKVDVTGRVMKEDISSISDMYGTIADDLLMYSFGQAVEKEKDEFNKQDLARAVLVKMCMDLAQVMGLNYYASGAKNLYVIGSLTDECPLIREEIAKQIGIRNLMATANTREPIEVKFIRYGGYLGAIGALLIGLKQDLFLSRM